MNKRVTDFLVGHTIEAVEDVLSRSATPADMTISRFFAARKYLGSHDRAFIADTTYALLRDSITLDWLIAPATTRADRHERPLLMTMAHLIRQDVDRRLLSRVAGIEREDLDELASAVREREKELESLDGALGTALRNSVPEWLADRVIVEYGDEAEALLASLRQQAPITLRANTLVTSAESLIESFDHHGTPAMPGRYAPDAVVLRKRINAFGVPEFRDGWFELQDEGSQLLSIALDPHPNWRVFDACAGAGGKSLHLAAIMKGRGEVVAHDLNSRRLAQLRPRLRRSGAQNIRTMEHDQYREKRAKLAESYNAVFIDAPCSGTGVLRRNPGARLTLNEEVVQRLLPQQSEILDEYSALVKPGGLMLYATCSLLRAENESQVEGFLGRRKEWSRVPIPLDQEMLTPEGYFRVLPNRHGTDGFFAALLKKSPE